MTAKRHEFEGELLTVAEIRERVPAVSETVIRRNLAAGRNTRQAMLTQYPSGTVSGRKAARRAAVTGNEPKCLRRKWA